MAAESLPFVTPADLARVDRELQALRAFLAEFLRSQDDQVGYKKALEITGIKSRTTLIAIGFGRTGERSAKVPRLPRRSPGCCRTSFSAGKNTTWDR